MRKILIVTLVIIVIIFGIIGYFEPKTALTSFLFLLPVVILFAFLGFLAFKFGRKRSTQYEEGFRSTLASLKLEYVYAHKLLHAVGSFEGFHLCFKYGLITLNDWAPLPGVFGKIAVLCRFKIPGTENISLHCTILPGNRSTKLRSSLGWQNPEPGFYVAKSKSQSNQDALLQFKKLSSETKEALKAVTAVFGGSCGIAPDWETVMVGKEDALRLAGNDPAVLAQLDFQVKIPYLTKPKKINNFLKTAGKAVALLSRDLAS